MSMNEAKVALKTQKRRSTNGIINMALSKFMIKAVVII